MVFPLTFCFLAPVLFRLPCDLQDDTHDAGSDDVGLEHTPRGAGPMLSLSCITSNIRICVFNRLKLILYHCYKRARSTLSLSCNSVSFRTVQRLSYNL